MWTLSTNIRNNGQHGRSELSTFWFAASAHQHLCIWTEIHPQFRDSLCLHYENHGCVQLYFRQILVRTIYDQN